MQHLVKIRGRWHYRRRIPADLQRHFPCAELRRNLRTSRVSSAETLAAAWHVKSEKLFTILRLNMLTDSQIETLVANYLRELLGRIEDRRNAKPKAEYAAWSQFRTRDGQHGRSNALASIAEIYRQFLVSGAIVDDVWLQEAAVGALADAGLTAAKGTADYNKLLRELVKGLLVFWEVEAQRSAGRYDSDAERQLVSRLQQAQKAEQHAQAQAAQILTQAIAPPQPDTPTLAEVIGLWEQDMRRRRKSDTSIFKYMTQLQLVRDLLGPERPISSITRLELDRLHDQLARIPARWKTSPFRQYTLDQILRDVEVPDEKRLSMATRNFYIQRVEELFRFAARNQWTPPGLGDRLQIPLTEEEKRESKRKPYTEDEISIILESLPLQGRKDTAENWIIPIAIFTGARQGEICQLDVTDIREEGGIHFFDFQTLDEDGDFDKRKRIKNFGSRRKTPIHPMLVKLGFLDFVNKLKKRNKNELFVDARTSDGQKLFGQAFRKLRDAVVINWKKKDFHSFRRTFTDGLKQKEVEPHIYNAIIGHAPTNPLDRRYTEQLNLASQYRAMLSLEFKLDIDRLKRKFRKF